MPSNNKLLRRKQELIQKQAQNNDIYDAINLLNTPELLNIIETLQPDHRERQLPPIKTLAMFISQVLNSDRSCQKVVNDAVLSRLSNRQPAISSFTGAYCKARKRLPLNMVSELVSLTGSLIDKQVIESWRWKGRKVRIVDGTTVSMPDTEENQEKYPQQKNQKPGLGFPIARIVGITCLASGAILNAAIGPYKGKGGSEHSLLRSLLDDFNADDIMLGDALYGSYFLLADCQKKSVDVLFQQHGSRARTTDFRKGKKLGKKDHLIELKKPAKRPEWMTVDAYNAAPNTIIMRECHIGNKVLITTLVDPNTASVKELKKLYQSRWNIELDFRNIKTTLGMETLSCKTPDMVEKEFWVYLLSYNLIRFIMVQSAQLTDLIPRQLSFKHTLQVWASWRQFYGVNKPVEMYIELLLLISERVVGNRPGRVEPRCVKRRPKPHPLLTKPRAEARAEIRKNGHPKKIK